MVRVAPIKLFYNPRTLWFDPGDLDIRDGDAVVVLTARGVEFGEATGDIFEVSDDEIKKLKTPLKPVKRLATEEDVQAAYEMERKSAEALPVFKEMAAEANADMHPVSVEYLLDGDKAVFYFEAEDRVDFRDLVRKLAAHFHVRIDMRQIGVRDEARMVGGLGHCGQELCCKRLGGEFCPVSIRMAKEQDLSLNPQKISGVCGRLMCCLRYEYDAYKDFKGRAPKQNGTVQTPDGPAKVVDLDVPREVVSLRLEGEKPVKVPLSDLETQGDSVRPNYIGEEAWQRATEQTTLSLVGGATFVTSQFTGKDQLAQAGSVRHVSNGSEKSRRKGQGSSVDSTPRNADSPVSSPSRKPRRRHAAKAASADAVNEASGQRQQRKQKQQQQQSQQQQSAGSSGKKRNGKKGQRNQDQGRSARADGQNLLRGKASGVANGENASRSSNGARSGAQAAGGAKQSPRPGQKSSGLRQGQRGKHASEESAREGVKLRRRHGQGDASKSAAGASASADVSTRAGSQGSVASRGNASRAAVPASDNVAAGGANAAGGDHRRTRRRSHRAGGAGSSQGGSGVSGSGGSRGAQGGSGGQRGSSEQGGAR